MEKSLKLCKESKIILLVTALLTIALFVVAMTVGLMQLGVIDKAIVPESEVKQIEDGYKAYSASKDAMFKYTPQSSGRYELKLDSNTGYYIKVLRQNSQNSYDYGEYRSLDPTYITDVGCYVSPDIDLSAHETYYFYIENYNSETIGISVEQA